MENEIALNHFVSVENLTNDQILTLIHNAEGFKNQTRKVSLTEPVYAANLFLKIQPGHTPVLIWQNGN